MRNKKSFIKLHFTSSLSPLNSLSLYLLGVTFGGWSKKMLVSLNLKPLKKRRLGLLSFFLRLAFRRLSLPLLSFLFFRILLSLFEFLSRYFRFRRCCPRYFLIRSTRPRSLLISFSEMSSTESGPFLICARVFFISLPRISSETSILDLLPRCFSLPRSLSLFSLVRSDTVAETIFKCNLPILLTKDEKKICIKFCILS